LPTYEPGQGWTLGNRDPKTLAVVMPLLQWAYQHYFHVQSDGWEHVRPDQPTLFVGAHNGGFAAPDMYMALYEWCRRFGVDRPAYGLMHPNVWRVFPQLAQWAMRLGAVQAHPKMAIAALRQGASVLVYPGGGQDAFRPSHQRDRIYFHERRGFIKLALREGVPIVPVISWGAHDCFWVLADGYPQVQQQLHHWGMPWPLGIDPEMFPIYVGLPWGLALGPLPHLPWPTPVDLRVLPAIAFDRYGREAAKDSAYVEACYQQVLTTMQRGLDQLILDSHQRRRV
jgi:1-acyl-sn-glycerol-3-phosphate acyltransferase